MNSEIEILKHEQRNKLKEIGKVLNLDFNLDELISSKHKEEAK